MRKIFSILMIFIFVTAIGAFSCKSSKSAVEKRVHKKRKKAGSLDCPVKDC